MFNLYDANGNGTLEYKELIGQLYPSGEQPEETTRSNNNDQNDRNDRDRQPITPRLNNRKGNNNNEEEINNIIEKIRDKLSDRGVRGMVNISKNFKVNYNKLILKTLIKILGYG